MIEEETARIRDQVGGERTKGLVPDRDGAVAADQPRLPPLPTPLRRLRPRFLRPSQCRPEWWRARSSIGRGGQRGLDRNASIAALPVTETPSSGYRNVHCHWKPSTSIRTGLSARASTLPRVEIDIANSERTMTSGIAVQISSSRLAPWICGPSAVRGRFRRR